MIITKNPDGTSTYGGTAFELLNVFAKHLNISLKIKTLFKLSIC